MSWALSCLKLSEYYECVELITDRYGKYLLVDCLDLPYSNTEIKLDFLDKYPHDLWAISKIYSYGLQNEPFLHVDGDVFIWQEIDQKMNQKPLVAQNIEYNLNLYHKALKIVTRKFKKLPDVLYNQKESKIYSINAGVVGGTNINFFKNFTKCAFSIIDNNYKRMNNNEMYLYNFIIEQYLFYCLANQQDIEISCLIDEIIDDPKYLGFANMDCVPQKKYIHVMGSYKKIYSVCKNLGRRLRIEYPKYYYRIIDLCYKYNLFQNSMYYYPVRYIEDQFYLKNKYINNTSFLLGRNSKLFKERISKSRIEDILPRTKLIINHLLRFNIDTEHNFINKIFHLFHNFKVLICNTNTIFDLLKFEIEKYVYTYNLKPDLTIYTKECIVDEIVDKLFTYNDSFLVDQVFSINKDIKIIKSKWSWSYHDTTLICQNLQNPPSIHETILIPDLERISIVEYPLNGLEIALLNTFSKPKKLRTAIYEMISYFDFNKMNRTKDEFRTLIIDLLKKMLHKSILQWEVR